MEGLKCISRNNSIGSSDYTRYVESIRLKVRTASGHFSPIKSEDRYDNSYRIDGEAILEDEYYLLVAVIHYKN